MGEMSEEGKSRGGGSGVVDGGGEQQVAPPPPQYYYGTFQGVRNFQPPPPQPIIGFPQPVPPPTATAQDPPYYPHGYQTVPGYAVTPRRPVFEHRLPCCGIGIGWFLFIIGFVCGAIPWYIGAFILMCFHVDQREKPGLIACVLAAILAVIAVTLGVTKANHDW